MDMILMSRSKAMAGRPSKYHIYLRVSINLIIFVFLFVCCRRDGYYYETVYGYTIEDHNVANSTLNPLAEEFVPGASSVAH